MFNVNQFGGVVPEDNTQKRNNGEAKPKDKLTHPVLTGVILHNRFQQVG